MSKVQDTIHRFVVDATIVAGCVCLVLTTKSVIGGMNNLNATISETRTLLNQVGVQFGSLSEEANQLIGRSGKLIGAAENIVAQLGGRGVSADGTVDQLNQTIAHIKGILERVIGTGENPGLLAQLRVTVDRLNNLVDQGSGLLGMLNDKAGHAIDGVNGLVDQVGGRTVVLTDSDKTKIRDTVNSMLACYFEYEEAASTKDSVGDELYGDNTHREVGYMCVFLETLSDDNKALNVPQNVLFKVKGDVMAFDAWYNEHKSQKCSVDNMKEFCLCLKALNGSLHSFADNLAVTEKGQSLSIERLMTAFSDACERFKKKGALSPF